MTDDLCAHAQEWIDCELVALLRLNDRFLKGDMERMVARIRELEADNAQLLARCNNLSADAETELKVDHDRIRELERELVAFGECAELWRRRAEEAELLMALLQIARGK